MGINRSSVQPALYIIVAYKSRDEIGPCLGSLPRELTAGPSRSWSWTTRRRWRRRDCATDYSWVRQVAAPENIGFGRANNLGFRQTSGECVLFLNPDTVSNATALGHCVRRLQAEPEIV